MLQLIEISLTRFKNYLSRRFEFSERIVCICGNNGTGKTSLLDAVYYLCFTKSYFTRSDSYSIQQGQNGFRVEGNFLLNNKEEEAVCILRETGKKEFSVNALIYEKFSQHIGHYPCVIIAPDDALLITGGSEERRKFLDALLSQLDADYLKHLIICNKLLQQRNAFLRSLAENAVTDLSLLDVLDRQIAKPGIFIFEKRKVFLESFLPLVKKLYDEIASQPEELIFSYDSELLKASYPDLLKASRQKDCRAQRSTSGIHKDDIEIFLGNMPFRNIASQGQRKSLLFALKLAEMEILKREKGFSPLLLLDDVFEKLDENRMTNLLQKVCKENDGQVFITDTNRERLEQHLSYLSLPYQLIELIN